MALSPTVIFEYFDGTNWTEAVDYASNSAVIRFELIKKLNTSATLSIVLTNPSKNFASTTATKSNALSSQGNLMSVLTDFMECRLKDVTTHTYLFRGRIYHTAHEYDLQLGSVVRVQAKDALAELGEFPLESSPLSLRKINLTESATNTTGEVIQYIVNGITDNIDTTNTDKFETSAATISSTEALMNKVNADGDGLFDIGKSSRTALRMIYDLAQADDPKTDTRSTTSGSSTGHIGNDYYVDPSFTRLNITTETTKPQMSYFKRGTKPGLIGSTLADPTKHGMTLEFPSSDFTGETNFKKPIRPDCNFETDTEKLYTSVVVSTTISDKTTAETLTTAQQGYSAKHEELTFELIEGTITNVAGWEGRSLKYEANEDTTSTQHLTGTATGTVSPLFLYEHGQTSPCATLHYQSGTGANQYCIIGNIHTAQEVTRGENVVGKYVSDNEIGYTGVTFRAFPTTGTVRLFTTKASGLDTSSTAITTITEDLTATETDVTVNSASNLQKYDVITIGTEDMLITNISSNTLTVLRKYNGTASSGETHDSGDSVVCMFIDINAATCRQSMVTGYNRPKRLILDAFTSSDKVIREAASALDRFTRKSITTARVNLMQYPIVKLDASASDITRSGNTITFASGAFTPADGSTAINNPEQFSVRKGHVIAELDANGGINRYALISATDATEVTYGNSGTDTSDGTELDASKDMRIFIPVEAGHSVRVKNKLWNKDLNVLVKEITYGVSNAGYLTCQVEGVGLENNSVGVFDYVLPSEPDFKKPYITTPDGFFSGQWKIVGGSIEAGHSSTASDNHDHVKVVAADGTSSLVKVVLPNGAAYPMAVGNYTIPATDTDTSNANSNKYYTLFLRPAGRLTSPLSSNATHLQVVINEGTAPTYADVAQPLNDIIFGTAQADDDVTGMVNLDLYQSGGNTNKPSLDVEVIPPNRLTSALLKKGAQPFTTTVEFKRYPDSASSVYNKFMWEGPSGATGRISFGQDQSNTIEVNNGNSDSDYSSGLTENTTYFAYLTIPTSGNANINVTNNYLLPFDDDKVLLATIVVGPEQTSTNHSPTILPYNGKVPTISAVAISANAIIADHIQAGSITAAKLETNLVISNTIKTTSTVGTTDGSANGSGLIINNSGITGYVSAGLAQTVFAGVSGEITAGQGKIVLDRDGVSIFTTSATSTMRFLYDGTYTYEDGSTVSKPLIASIGCFASSDDRDGIMMFNVHDPEPGQTQDIQVIGIGHERTGVTGDGARPYRIYINGKIKITDGSLPAEGGTALYVNSDDIITKASSSRRYKENIIDLSLATSDIFNLQPVEFNFKTNKNTKTFGLIAEDVYEIIPELVSFNSNHEPESVNYSLLSVLLLEEVKKLRIEVDALKNG